MTSNAAGPAQRGPPPDLSRYRLSDIESHHIFTTRIIPDELSSIPSSTTPSQPLAVFLVGQTGAGKSSLSPTLLSAFQQAGRHTPGHFIADTYKTYHPDYETLMRESPRWASPAAGPDARRWLEMVTEEAARRRVDVLVESACREPRDCTALVRILRAAGYRINVILLAVPEGLSRLGLLIRYYKHLPEARSKGLPLRLTPPKVHGDSYAGLIEIARFLGESDVADQVLVVRRGGFVAGGRRRGDEQVAGEMVRILEEQRAMPLVESERVKADEDVEFMADYAEAAGELEAIKKMLGRLDDGAGEASDGGTSRMEPLVFVNMDDGGNNQSTGYNVVQM